MSGTYSAGSIVIRAWWNLKDQQQPYAQASSGSPPTSTRETGTQTSTQEHSQLYFDD